MTIAQHYCRYHQTEDLAILADVVSRVAPGYLSAFYEVMASNAFSPYNIIIARKEVIDEYCEWLFAVLDACESLIDPFSGHPGNQRRVFGYLAERLLNVWLLGSGKRCREYPIWSESPSVVEAVAARRVPSVLGRKLVRTAFLSAFGFLTLSNSLIT